MLSLRQETESLVRELVGCASIVGTAGEVDFARQVFGFFTGLAYFKAHPQQLIMQPTREDDHLRFNVIALVIGKAAARSDTLLLLGHMDTVGVEDYNKLSALAFTPDELKKQIDTANLPDTVTAEIRDANWLLGRGILDMKSGLAAQMLAIKQAAENADTLNGNLLFLAECDEEDNSRGVLSALPLLEELAQQYHLKLEGAINADYTAPRYQDDNSRYLYYGTVGKQLPAFYVVGKETHVGDPFGGLDPNYLAAHLVEQISYNPAFCDVSQNEFTMPPVTLKQTDFKPFYTVQTNISSLVYFNLAVHHWSPEAILTRMCAAAETSFREALEKLQSHYDAYCSQSSLPQQKLPWQPRVLTYKEMVDHATADHGEIFLHALEEYAIQLAQTPIDLREYNTAMVQFVWQWQQDKRPAIIVFFASVYYPRIQLDRSNSRDNRLIHAVESAVSQSADVLQPYHLEKRFFYPYISDASFLSLSDNAPAISAYTDNYPAYLHKQRIDFDLIGRISMPVVNIGAYGKNAHQYLER
ncbi:MAG TPA: M20/M25/M40 family metallo-hydrolase, partial [Bacillota bacterium]|nr:M20/M25/M40 family metallo-hydrolase [Bacillota bacterium]